MPNSSRAGKKTGDVTALVVDHGIFLPVARRLSRDFKKVYYYTPNERAFPTVNDLIGDGFPDIERVSTIWEHFEEIDVFVFCDIGFSKLQTYLLKLGKRVWGSRTGDIFEVSRGNFLKELKTTTLPVPPCKEIIGMTALKSHLISQKNKFIKLSKFRKDWETLHWRDWEQDESELDWRSVKLGPWKERLHFFVFDPIDTDIEDGVDTYCIDGQWPSLVIHGMEAKDKAFLAAFQKFEELPEEMKIVNEEIAPILKKHGYRNFFSTEVRITKDGKSFLIDPCCRAGSPPHQVQCEMIGNYGEVIWQGSNGNCIDPEPASQFGVQALLCSKGDRRSWTTIRFPRELDQWVKCGFCSLIDGRTCFAPDFEASGSDIGWLTAIGNSIEEAIENLRGHCELLPEGVSCDVTSLAELLKEAQTAEEKGMTFSDQEIPGPATVLED